MREQRSVHLVVASDIHGMALNVYKMYVKERFQRIRAFACLHKFQILTMNL